MKTLISAALFGASCLIAPMASAGGYMKIDGIDGESQATRHEDWIDIISMSEGYAISNSASVGSGRAMSRASTDGLTVTKEMDASSVYLRQALLRNQRIPEVVIDFTKGGSLPYLTITMENVRVAEVEANVESKSSEEEVTFRFEKIKWKYVEIGRDGSAGDEHEIEYDIAAGR